MAFENFDKQAVAEMAKAYDKSQQTKVGFWGGLLSILGVVGNSVAAESGSENASEEYSRETDLDYVSNNESPNSMGGWVRFDNNYSPMTGHQSWD